VIYRCLVMTRDDEVLATTRVVSSERMAMAHGYLSLGSLLRGRLRTMPENKLGVYLLVQRQRANRTKWEMLAGYPVGVGSRQ
jgi:hypothetical protein